MNLDLRNCNWDIIIHLYPDVKCFWLESKKKIAHWATVYAIEPVYTLLVKFILLFKNAAKTIYWAKNCFKENVKNGLWLIRNEMSIRAASKESRVPLTTFKSCSDNTTHVRSLDDQRLEPNYSVNKIFTAEQEKKFQEYFDNCALLFYGLISKEI